MCRRRLLVLGLPVTLLLVTGCANAAQPGDHGPKVLSQAALMDRVGTVLRSHYKLEVDSLSCPGGEPVRVGRSFDCDVVVGGNAQKVTVTITGGDGSYDVGLPH